MGWKTDYSWKEKPHCKKADNLLLMQERLLESISVYFRSESILT